MLSWNSNSNTFLIFWQKYAYFNELFKWALSKTHGGIDFLFCSRFIFSNQFLQYTLAMENVKITDQQGVLQNCGS
jgi:hypothetical protein